MQICYNITKKSLASTQFINNNDVSLFKMLVEKIKYKVI